LLKIALFLSFFRSVTQLYVSKKKLSNEQKMANICLKAKSLNHFTKYSLFLSQQHTLTYKYYEKSTTNNSFIAFINVTVLYHQETDVVSSGFR